MQVKRNNNSKRTNVQQVKTNKKGITDTKEEKEIEHHRRTIFYIYLYIYLYNLYVSIKVAHNLLKLKIAAIIACIYVCKLSSACGYP